LTVSGEQALETGEDRAIVIECDDEIEPNIGWLWE